MWPPRRQSRYLIVAAVLVIFIYFGQSRGSIRSSNNTILDDLSVGQRKTGVDRMVKSSFDWGKVSPHFSISSITPLPTRKPTLQPKIQYNFQAEPRDVLNRLDSQRLEVRKAFQKCWNNYKKFAWMRDELTPISGAAKNTFGGWAATLVDSLDSLWILGLKDDFIEAVEAVATIDWANTTSTSANLFETTIRHLGGLLAAYDLSREQVLLAKAIELGDMLYAGFDTPNRMPGFWIDFEKAKSGGQTADDHQPSASPCSLSLEFTRLSQLTGDPKYYDAITRVTALLKQHQNSTKLPGMWPAFLDMQNLVFDDNYFTLGALADSLYEYLPKMHALIGDVDPVYQMLAKDSLATIKEHILFRPMLPDKADILFAGDVRVDQEDGHINMHAEGQHLSCFVGGMFALSGRLFEMKEYVDIGAKLTKGCIFAYNAFPTGIMPEYFNMLPCHSLGGCEWDEERWKKDGNAKLPKGFKDARVPTYLLRPEAIESVFIMYRITGRREYQDAAWKMFQAIMKATETEFGNAAIDDVTITGPTTKKDSMESFWLSETLKYFYLIFSPPDVINLDDYVLNTEAHPLRRLQ